MSYCRWSTDDYQCDVYTWADVTGIWVTHVARTRYRLKEPLPAPVHLPDPPTDADTRAWARRHAEVTRIVGISPALPIGLPYDGQRFEDPTPQDAANTLVMLQQTGYHVPQSAIDTLRAEVAESSQA